MHPDAEAEPGHHDIMVCLDGGRALEREFFNQLVKPDGNPWDNRTKTAFHIIYDENSVSARKTRVRGMLSLSETMLVYTTDSALQVTKKTACTTLEPRMG